MCMCGRYVDDDHCMVQASEGLLKKHYAELSEKKFFPGLIKFMQSGPVVAMVSWARGHLSVVMLCVHVCVGVGG